MSSKEIIVTSKNQITLPAAFVKKLHLGKGRILQAEIKEGQIILTPAPSLSLQMQRFWTKHHAQNPLTDEELRQAIRQSAAEGASC